MPPPLPLNWGSGMSMPCSRMHEAKSSIACSASAWSVSPPAAAVVVVVVPVPATEATRAASGGAAATGGEHRQAGDAEGGEPVDGVVVMARRCEIDPERRTELG